MVVEQRPCTYFDCLSLSITRYGFIIGCVFVYNDYLNKCERWWTTFCVAHVNIPTQQTQNKMSTHLNDIEDLMGHFPSYFRLKIGMPWFEALNCASVSVMTHTLRTPHTSWMYQFYQWTHLYVTHLLALSLLLIFHANKIKQVQKQSNRAKKKRNNPTTMEPNVKINDVNNIESVYDFPWSWEPMHL